MEWRRGKFQQDQRQFFAEIVIDWCRGQELETDEALGALVVVAHSPTLPTFFLDFRG